VHEGCDLARGESNPFALGDKGDAWIVQELSRVEAGSIEGQANKHGIRELLWYSCDIMTHETEKIARRRAFL